MIHESVMQDTDDYKSKRRTKDTERKHLKRKKAKENQIPKIQKDEDLAGEDEEYSVEKVLGKRLGKKGTIGKLTTI